MLNGILLIKMKTRLLIILGTIGFVAGLIMYFYGVILIAEYYSGQSAPGYDPHISYVIPIHYIQYMTLFAIPISLVSATVIAFGFIKSKYNYVYMPVISILLIAAWFGILLSVGS